ncbi:MAG: hypothetical protein JO091_13055 [Acidobacteriaceae bacterium]|nr:hypothetical protein [Acidobacteriaceae bacterium]
MRVSVILTLALLSTGFAGRQSIASQSSAQSNPEKKTAPGQPDPAAASSPASSAAPSQPAAPQTPIEFESRGLGYQALTRNGITVMFALLPPHIKDYNIMQITVTNGSLVSWTVKPGDFAFVRQDGTVLQAVSADDVVESLLEKATRQDVIKLQLLYEDSIYALSNFRSTNGYEKRREAAMAQFVKPEFKAAAAASAITMIPTRLKSGDSTDGAIFFENRTKEKTLGAGRFLAHTCGEIFEFPVYPELKLR